MTTINLVNAKNLLTLYMIRHLLFVRFAVKEAGEGTENFKDGYGLHFSLEDSNQKYTLFIDKPQNEYGFYNKFYDASNSSAELLDEDIRIMNIGTSSPNYRIIKVCVIPDGTECADETGGSVDIVFVRPNPDAYITYNGTGGAVYTGAIIYLEDTTLSPPVPRQIYINSTGQISIQ